MAGDKKTVVKPFRMTEKEAEKLRLDAEQRGIRNQNISDCYCRRSRMITLRYGLCSVS